MESRRHEDVLILAPEGNMVGKAETTEFEQAFIEALERGERYVVVDLSSVRHANSTGLGALVAAHLKAREVGSRLVLVHVAKRIVDVLEITHLSSVFLIAGSEEEAMRLVRG